MSPPKRSKADYHPLEKKHPTYKLVPAPVHTVETAWEWVRAELLRLADECLLVSTKFGRGTEQAEGFHLAGRELVAIHGLLDNVPCSLQYLTPEFRNREVRFQLFVPRRQAHRKSRWSMTGDCARALDAIRDMMPDDGSVDVMRESLFGVVCGLNRVQFPRLHFGSPA